MTENVLPRDGASAWERVARRVEAQSWPAGALYVVATPIGNLGDLTLRAWQALDLADVIAAEDTRATRSLLEAWGIATPMMSAHRHNEASAAVAIVERLRAGARVALVSDAGTPAVSDPGGRIVQAVRDAGLRVVPLPGASAAVTALMTVGVTTDANPGFAFAGFSPVKSAARQRWMRRWLVVPGALIFYETPHRIRESLADLLAVAGPSRQVSLARELTKRFEEVATFPLAQGQAWLDADAHREQGEYVVVVHPLAPRDDEDETQDSAAGLDAWLDALLAQVSVRDAARIAARATGQSRDSIYARALARKEEHSG
jgi:16S rRNA (cytidine1402-2'-O)-methyltransferase